MLLQYKKKDLGDLVAGNHELYNLYSLIADKLRTIYVALGWTHMTGEFSGADNIIEELTKHVFEELDNGAKETQCATAGLQVSGYFDEEDMLNLDYNFRLI